MHNIAELILSWIVTTALTFAIIMLDERWMSAERLERAWPPTSRDAAIIAFGPLALLLHFMRTRGSFVSRWKRLVFGVPLGFGMGVVALLVVSIVGAVLVNVMLMILGYPVDWSLE
ncbi:MAG: hypothetical protein U0270_10265 [Labilithrix sp.]